MLYTTYPQYKYVYFSILSMTLNVNSNYLQPKTCLTKFIYDPLKCLEVFTLPPASKHLSNVNLKANIKFSQKSQPIVIIIITSYNNEIYR